MIVLRRTVEVDAFVALAEIGVASKREDISAVLALAKEPSDQLTPEDVNTKLLGRPPESPHGERILMQIESYGLIERSGTGANSPYRMTEAGRENLGKSEVMIPEEGPYVFYTTTDPLLKESILKIENAPFIEKNESQGYFGSKKDQNSTELKRKSLEKPEYLEKYARGYALRQVANSNLPVQVNSISERVARSDKRLNVDVALELEMGAPPVIEVKSAMSSAPAKVVYSETLFDIEYTKVLETLCAHVGRLDVLEGEPTLLLAWGQLGKGEAERFSKMVRIESPTIPKFGRFQNLSIELPILPATQKDAAEWANHLLRDSIRSYVDEPEYLRIRAETVAKFLKKYTSDSLMASLPDLESLTKETVKQRTSESTSELYWYLLAPKDLSSR